MTTPSPSEEVQGRKTAYSYQPVLIGTVDGNGHVLTCVSYDDYKALQSRLTAMEQREGIWRDLLITVRNKAEQGFYERDVAVLSTIERMVESAFLAALTERDGQ